MSRDILNKAREVVQKAEKYGAQGVRATIDRQRDSEVEWLDQGLERVRESTTMGLGLTLYADGCYSSHNTSDLRSEALDTFIEDAVDLTRLLAKDEHRKLPDAKYFENQFKGDLKQYDPKGSEMVTGADRRRIAKDLVDATYSAPGGDIIVSSKSSCSDSLYETAKVTSNGMEGHAIGTFFSFWVQTTVQDEGDRRPRSFWFDGSLLRNQLGSVEETGRMAVKRVLEEVGQKPIETGKYNCIIENRQVRRVLGGLLGPLNGGSIQQQRSFLAEKMGQQIASPLFSMTDDPHIPSAFGSSTFDNEGMSTRRRPIIEDGVLRNFYLNTYYASKLGLEPTTGDSTNLVFKTGEHDLEGLIRKMGDGLLLTGFSGGNSNGATGDFSIGVKGHLIRGGKRVQPIAEMNLGGNHGEIWKQITAVGNDEYLKSSVRVPSILFEGLQFSGV